MAHLLEKLEKLLLSWKRSDEQLQEELPTMRLPVNLADIIDCNACIVNSKGTSPWLFYALQNQYRSCRAILPD